MKLKKKIYQLFNSQSIRTATIGSLGIKLFSALFALLTSILLARLMSIESYGYYILAFTIVTVLSVPVSLGLPNLIVRYVSKYKVSGQTQEIKGLIIRSNQIVLISFIVILLGSLFSYTIWWYTYNIEFIKTVWVGFIVLFFMGLGAIRSATLRGLKLIILGQLPDTLLRNFLLCLGILIYYFIGYKLSPYIAMIIHAISAAIAYFVGHLFLYRKLLINIKNLTPKFHNKLWFKEAIPFSINGGVQIVRSKLVTFVLAAFGTLEGVAIYDVALRGASLVSFTLDALNTATAPYISSAFESNKLITLQNIVTKTSRIISLSAIPIVLVFIFGGTKLLEVLFGKEYGVAYFPLIIMCVGQFLSSLTGSVGLVLSMTGNQSYFTKSNIYVTILNILISIPFVILWDVIGASFLFSFLLITQNLILFIYIRNKLKINTTVFSYKL